MAKKKRKRATDLAVVITAAEKVAVLSDVFLAVKKKRFEIDQSSITLTDTQRRLLNAEYDVARDAYYKGLNAFVDATEPAVHAIIAKIGETRSTLDSLAVKQENAARILEVISSFVGLASKLVVLGTL